MSRLYCVTETDAIKTTHTARFDSLRLPQFICCSTNVCPRAVCVTVVWTSKDPKPQVHITVDGKLDYEVEEVD
jgi:hypothetical protein